MFMSALPIIAAYYYPGWHSCPVRDAAFPEGWSEWDLVRGCAPRFSGHEQPNVPLWGRQDESEPAVFEQKIKTAGEHGVDVFAFALFWSRGKRLLGAALDRGFLGCSLNGGLKFAVMWANRMPRRVLPVKDPKARLIDPGRLVYTDAEDFMELVKFAASRYFSRPEYFRYAGACYFSIFDTNFFLRQMGLGNAAAAISRARAWLLREGYGPLHLAAIDPAKRFRPFLRETGFDSVTHYILLPEWKGDFLQDFETAAAARVRQWSEHAAATGLPYFPSVSPGWDASPRAADYRKERPRRYPWWPVVTGRSPEIFGGFLAEAIDFSKVSTPEAPMCFVSSWNEWSEGHYLEPDERYGFGWLDAVGKARHGS